MGYRVVLTADTTLMSSYNGSQFVGFAACFPRVLPKWLYTKLFCPAQRNGNGLASAAPAGLRRVESALLRSGIPRDEIAVALPYRLAGVIGPDTRVVGVSTTDPMGCGPASSTFSNLLGKEAYTKYFFRKLMGDPALRASGAKVIVGGPGAWQLHDPSVRKSLRIDCLVEGEGDLIAPELFADAIAGRELPDMVTGGPVPVDEIPGIAGPTINGTVEISRGCGRGCQFCNPNMRTVRSVPLEMILEEVRLNLAHSPKITLHTEDVLRYKAKGIRPNRPEVTTLFEEVAKLTEEVGLSHIALSSALSEPGLVEDIAHLTGAVDGRKSCYAQTGIETGSPHIVEKHMRGKARPYKPAEWPDVVRESFKLLSDSSWIPCGTLVVGLPGERKEDVEKTIDLIRDLRPYKSLIVPLFFVPLGRMTEDEFFTTDDMLPEHWILLSECIEHDFHWAGVLMGELFRQNRLSATKSQLFRLAAWYMRWRLKPYLEAMREGTNPLTADEMALSGMEGLEEAEA